MTPLPRLHSPFCVKSGKSGACGPCFRVVSRGATCPAVVLSQQVRNQLGSDCSGFADGTSKVGGRAEPAGTTRRLRRPYCRTRPGGGGRRPGGGRRAVAGGRR